MTLRRRLVAVLMPAAIIPRTARKFGHSSVLLLAGRKWSRPDTNAWKGRGSESG